MKKSILSFCFIFIFAFFSFAENFTAQVTTVSGKAEVLTGTEWKTLNVGDTLKNGDTVQTGFKSSLSLKVKDSVINVSALTRMTVEQLSENAQKDNVRVFVKTGGVSSNVQKSNNKKVGFTVRTPVATASVRGTEFSVENTFNSSSVETMRGSVAVWKSSNSVQVSKNSDSDENKNQENKDESLESDSIGGSFEDAPHGTVFVNQEQGTEISSIGNVSAPGERAASGVKLDDGTKNPFDFGRPQENGPNVNTKKSDSTLRVNITVE